MTEIAEATADNSALVVRNLTFAQQAALIQQHLGYTVVGQNLDSWSTDELLSAHMVRVTPVTPPVATWGYRAEQDPDGEKIGSAWHEKWVIVQDGTIQQLKVRAAGEVKDITRGKLDDIAENKGEGFIFARLMLFDDHNRFQHDGLTDPAEHPMLNAYRITEGLAAGQVDAAVNTLRKQWQTRAGNILIAEKNHLDQIAAPATDTPEELKAIIDSAQQA